MKKIVVLCLVVTLLLCACSQRRTSTQSPPPGYQGAVDSYEELFDYVEKYSDVPDGTQSAQLSYEEKLCQILFANVKEKALPIPCLNEKAVDLKYRGEDFYIITLFSTDSYGRPSIWYFSEFNGEMVTICIMMDQTVLEEIDPSASGAEVRRHLKPDCPNVDNYKKDDPYAYIIEQSITTSDGEKVALVYKFAQHENRIYTEFLQDGYLVEVWADKGVVTDEWFANFSIEKAFSMDDHIFA